MSATGLDVFDNTVQTTQNRGPPGTRSASRLAYSRRRAASLRDRLPLDEAAHLGAQLPLLVRGPIRRMVSCLRYPQGPSPEGVPRPCR
jgi:uncharacterized protein (DUF2267 family)